MFTMSVASLIEQLTPQFAAGVMIHKRHWWNSKAVERWYFYDEHSLKTIIFSSKLPRRAYSYSTWYKPQDITKPRFLFVRSVSTRRNYRTRS